MFDLLVFEPATQRDGASTLPLRYSVSTLVYAGSQDQVAVFCSMYYSHRLISLMSHDQTALSTLLKGLGHCVSLWQFDHEIDTFKLLH